MPLSSLPVGTLGNDTLVKYLTLFGEKIVWRIIGRDLEIMKDENGDQLSDSTTLFMDKIVALRPFDAAEPKNQNTDCKYGSNQWEYSNLRQWANSSASAGEWYSPSTSTDQPPSEENVMKSEDDIAINPYENEAGMLYESSQAERDLALVTRHTRYANNNTCSNDDRFFPISDAFYKDSTGNIPYFTDNDSRIAYCTSQCILHSNYSKNPTLEDAWYYWTSSGYYYTWSYLYHPEVVCCVSPAGESNNNGFEAYSGIYGVRLICNIPTSTTLVTPTPDADGCYTILA